MFRLVQRNCRSPSSSSSSLSFVKPRSFHFIRNCPKIYGLGTLSKIRTINCNFHYNPIYYNRLVYFSDNPNFSSPNFSPPNFSSPNPSSPNPSSPNSSSNSSNEQLKKQILEESLKYVNIHGWSVKAIEEGAKSLGLSPMSSGLFYRGPIELVEYFFDKTSEKWMEQIKKKEEEFNKKNTVEKIHYAITLRLQLQSKVQENWAKAIAISIEPSNVQSSLERIGKFVDEVWHITGDKSHKMDWYTKRMMLSTIYTLTELYMLTDSPPYDDTWKFLEKLLHDSSSIAKLPHDSQELLSAGTRFLFSNLWEAFQSFSKRQK